MDAATLVDQYMRIVGSDPQEIFQNALDEAGCETRVDSSGQWMSNCPAHEDRKASLHWKVTAYGQLFFHCFAGCEFGEILGALGLRTYQTRPVHQDFDYYEPDGTYLFTVRRRNTAGEKGKEFYQYRRGDDGTEEPGNGLEPGESVLWLEPSLNEAAEDARAAGRKLTVWIPEGEKDVIAVWESGSLGEWDFATTSPQGASFWKPVHATRLNQLYEAGVLESVVIVCDSDPAGVRRGMRVSESLSQVSPDLPVRILRTKPGDDVAEIAGRWGAKWVEMMEEITDSELSESMEEGSPATNYMLRIPLGAGAKAARRGMAIRSQSKSGADEINLVLNGEIEPIEAWEDGWTVRVTPPTFDPIEIALTHEDLTAKAAFDRWLARAGVAIVPKCGYGADTVASSLRVFCQWYSRTHEIRHVRTTRYLTWVDPVTGEPAKKASDRNPPVFVTPEAGEPDSEAPVRWIGTERAGCKWGENYTELDAAWAMARALTFADERAVAQICGWAASVILAPWISAHTSGTKPGMAIVAPSASGKTHGAGRLLLQLAGCEGQINSSVAAIRRRLAKGGVSSIQWLDDTAIVDDPKMKELLRTAASGTDYSLANPDAGAMATDDVHLTGSVAISAEGLSWLGETAMQDRFLQVDLPDPKPRRSLRTDRPDEAQFADYRDVVREFNDDLTQLALWVVRGIAAPEIVADVDANGLTRLDRWVEAIGGQKGRGDTPAFVVAIGARAVAWWLHGVKARAGDAWPSKTPPWTHERYSSWGWLVTEADAALQEARDRGPGWNSLVTQAIPAVLESDMTSVSGHGSTKYVIEDVPVGSVEGFRRAVQSRIAMAGMELPLPMVIVDKERRVWVWTSALATWYTKEFRNAETRVHSAMALEQQLTPLLDDPEWATWKDSKGAGRPTVERPGLRLTKRAGKVTKALYHRLNAEASAALLPGSEEDE